MTIAAITDAEIMTVFDHHEPPGHALTTAEVVAAVGRARDADHETIRLHYLPALIRRQLTGLAAAGRLVRAHGTDGYTIGATCRRTAVVWWNSPERIAVHTTRQAEATATHRRLVAVRDQLDTLLAGRLEAVHTVTVQDGQLTLTVDEAGGSRLLRFLQDRL